MNWNLPTRIAATILATSWMVMSVAASEPAAAPVTKPGMPGIANFSRIDGSTGLAGSVVGFGGATQSSAMPALRKNGFASVINLRLATEPGADVDAERAAAEAEGLKYIHLPFNSANPDPGLVDSFLAAVFDKKNQPVYIHCASANRVGALWMITRVLGDGWEIDAAHDEARSVGLKPSAPEEFATDHIASHRP